MSDHREPIATISIPSPSSANVPCVQSEQTSAVFDKENIQSAAQTPYAIVDHKLDSGKSTLEAAIPSSEEEASSVDQSAKGIPYTFATQTLPCEPELNSQAVKNTICHSLTSVVPILSQAAPPSNIAITTSSTVAHPVASLLPTVVPPVVATCTKLPLNAVPSSSTASSAVPPNVLKPNTATNVQQPLRTLGTSSRPKHPIEEPIPDFIPQFLPGKIDAKKFPARHFELGTLDIGSWKHESKPNGSFTPATSRLKVIFSQKKFVYEFEQRTINNPGVITMFQKEKMMASIEVPFSSIVGLNMSKDNPCHVVIEVNTPPTMYIGKQVLYSPSTGSALPTKYDTSKSVDLTGGQLLSVPYHKLKLSNNHLRSRLQSFDPRFDAMLRTPITMDLTKRLTQQPSAQSTRHRKSSENAGPSAPKRSRKSPSSSASGEGANCTCSSGCKKRICGCFKMNGKCGSECKCVSCQNPLNILADNGVDIDEAKNDVCLMNNISKIKDLDKFLKENHVTTDCCDADLPMKDVCGGVVTCPECEDGEYRYSWCDFSLHDDECRPRNHCSICKRCGDYRDDHCFKCNKCYFAGSAGSFKCPCEERRVSFVDILGSFLSDLHGPESDSDNDYF